MPMYDYECAECHKSFESLARTEDYNPKDCKYCQKELIASRQISPTSQYRCKGTTGFYSKEAYKT